LSAADHPIGVSPGRDLWQSKVSNQYRLCHLDGSAGGAVGRQLAGELRCHRVPGCKELEGETVGAIFGLNDGQALHLSSLGPLDHVHVDPLPHACEYT
jgi:hypothetical protein